MEESGCIYIIAITIIGFATLAMASMPAITEKTRITSIIIHGCTAAFSMRRLGKQFTEEIRQD